MADRDWERELADIDRRLASIPDESTAASAPAPAAAEAPRGRRATPAPASAPLAPAPASGTAAASAAPADRAAGRSLGTPAQRPGQRSWRTQFALLFHVVLGACVVAALFYWPYPSRCGIQLGYYLALVGALGVAGLLTSVSAWRHRAAFVHLLGLAMLTGAGVLAAREVLPRTGYALPTPEHPAAWSCG